jgi:ANTAR domain
MAVDRRTAIGKAVGMIMERFDLSDDRAFDVLRRLSSHENRWTGVRLTCVIPPRVGRLLQPPHVSAGRTASLELWVRECPVEPILALAVHRGIAL